MVLTGREYLEKHNNVANVIHQGLAEYYKFTEGSKPYYHNTQAILRNKNITIYWDKPIIMDHMVPNTKPDILVLQKIEKKAVINEIGVPKDNNMYKVVKQKVRKYQQLYEELKQFNRLKEGKVVLFIIFSNGLVLEDTLKSC